MRVVVVGVNSFSGSHFASFLLTQGIRVLGLSRSEPPDQHFLPSNLDPAAGEYEFRQVDLNSGPRDVLNSIYDFQPSHIVNFASQGMVAESWDSPWDWYRTNTVGLSNLAHAAMQITDLEKFVHVSTPEVYGNQSFRISESHEFSPSTPYAISRAAGDWHLLALNRNFGFPVVFTRAANVYGPGQQLYRVIPKAVLSVLAHRPFPLHGKGESKRNFCHIQDVVTATYSIMSRGEIATAYHISTGELISIAHLLRKVSKVLGSSGPHNLETAPDRVGKDAVYDLSSDRIRRELGWQPQVLLDAGIISVAEWISGDLDFFASADSHYVHKA